MSSTFHCTVKYRRTSVNEKLGFDRDNSGGGNVDGKRAGEREGGKKERNSVLRDDRKRWRVTYYVS